MIEQATSEEYKGYFILHVPYGCGRGCCYRVGNEADQLAMTSQDYFAYREMPADKGYWARNFGTRKDAVDWIDADCPDAEWR